MADPDSVVMDAVVAAVAIAVTEADDAVVEAVVNAVLGSGTTGFDNDPKVNPANAGEVIELAAVVVVGGE